MLQWPRIIAFPRSTTCRTTGPTLHPSLAALAPSCSMIFQREVAAGFNEAHLRRQRTYLTETLDCKAALANICLIRT